MRTHKLRETLAEVFSPGGSDRLGTVAFTLLVLLVAFGPLLYGVPSATARPAVGGGAAAPRGDALLCGMAFLTAALVLLSKSSASAERLPGVPLGAAAALALLGAIQLLPLPEGVIGALAPTNLQIYHETLEILRLFGRSALHSVRISIAPSETVSAFLLIGAYVALFMCSAKLLQSRARRRVFAVLLFGSVLLQVLWAEAIRPEPRLRGLFVDPDHFAGYLEIALGLAFGAIWAEALTNRDRTIDVEDRSERFERRFPPMAVRILLWGLIAAGITLTESRGGILAAAVSTLALLAAALNQRRSRRPRRAVTAAALAVLIGSALAAGLAGRGRFQRFLLTDPRDLGSTTRVAIWKTSWDAWREFPVVGSGLGTFREAFRRVQPRELASLVEHAHDDFLEIAVTGGAVGAICGTVLVVSLLVAFARVAKRQRHREESAFALGGFGALLSLTLHGLVDFSLSIPIITATLACALGAAWAAGNRT
jgi:O-antigen ligase